jgi:hypothetical protein
MMFRLLAVPGVAAAALLAATPGFADNTENRSCPNNTDWMLVPAIVDPQKDNNEDGVICQKFTEGNGSKDNNNPPESTDNAFPEL